MSKVVDKSRELFFENKNCLFKGIEFLEDRVSVGLVGHGSELFGFDDNVSRDHDWGIGYGIWLNDEDYNVFQNELSNRYIKLVSSYKSVYPIICTKKSYPPRVGPIKESDFLRFYLSSDYLDTNSDWLIEEKNLAFLSNGELFTNSVTKISSIRKLLNNYYPADVYYRRLSYNLFLLGQTFQYNYFRMLDRYDKMSAHYILITSIDYLLDVVFLLNKTYSPYYKWRIKKLEELPFLSNEVLELLDSINKGIDVTHIYLNIIQVILNYLEETEIGTKSNSLIDQAIYIHGKIEDNNLKGMNVMELYNGKYN